jgi:peroxiredoxin
MVKRVVLLLAVTLLVAAGAARAEGEGKVFKAGDSMPDFLLKNGLTGEEVSFNEQIKGKSPVIVIVFFNTGCSACIAEMDEASKAAVELGEEKVQVFGIAVDKRGAQAVRAYDEIYKYQVTYLLDPTFSMPPKFGFSYTPASVFVGGDGTIRVVKGGFDPVKDGGVVMKEIKTILGN